MREKDVAYCLIASLGALTYWNKRISMIQKKENKFVNVETLIKAAIICIRWWINYKIKPSQAYAKIDKKDTKGMLLRKDIHHIQ